MANTFKFGNGEWAVGKETALAYNDENNNFKPLPFSFDRASSATVVNKNGLIETVGVDEPRIDFLNNPKGHLLLEPSRQNKITYSEDFSQGYWVKDDVTLESASITDPSGSTGAYLMKGNTNTSRHHIQANSDTTTDSIISVFAKKKELRYLQLASANSANQYANFDLEAGVVGVVGSGFSNPKIENYGNGWYRLSVKSNSQNQNVYISLVSSGSAGWLESWSMDNATDGLYLWGAQHEEGSYATSYIPTSGSAVTRSAETCEGAGNNQVINSTEGTIYAEQKSLETNFTYNYFVTVSDGTNNNRLEIRQSGTGLQFLWRVGGIYQSQILKTNAPFASTIKFALRYSSTDIKFYVNGLLVGTINSPTLYSTGTLNNIEFADGSGGNSFRGIVKECKYYNTALSDSELQALTTI